MDKNALLNYALFARKELETQIALSLNNLGITKDGVANAKKVGDVYAIDGIQESISERVYELRKRIIESHIKNAKFEDVVEEFAYTWFNRIVAIRFMEVHDYFSHGFRVLTSRDGSYEPEILKNLPFVAQELRLDEKRVTTYQEQNRVEDLYRYVLVQQCNALQDIIPMLFEEQGAYLELLLPNNLLSQDSIIRRIEDIPEEDFLNDVEVVGWLYQFYNSVKKDEVFASKKKITKETLPAVTQLFTPDWIVRYMAENSIGRIWLESYPNSPIRNEMKYYVDDAEQTEEVQKKIDKIKYKNVKPEDIRIIEPCCGSGHILVYAFELLNKMYLEQGYEKREIPALILKNNLYGLDVDKRAAQLAQFSLIMKARSIDNRFFNEERYITPMVYEIIDSQAIEDDYRDHMGTLKFSKESIDTAYYLVKTFKDGKLIGSLLKVEDRDYDSFISEIDKVKNGDIPGLFEQNFFHYGLSILKQLAELAIVLSQKYDVMITNPPYCGMSSFDDTMKKYATDNYPNSKTDMFAMFMEMGCVKSSGIRSMVNMHSWMFLSSYESLRAELISKTTLISLIHLGARAFEEISGEIVQTVAFVLRNKSLQGYQGNYFRLISESTSREKEMAFLDKTGIQKFKQEDFLLIPGYPIAYWVSKNFIGNFSKDKIGDSYFSGGRNKTHNNEKYTRLWWEISNTKKWQLYLKGGEFRKWYGNHIFVVDWSDDAKREYDSHGGLYNQHFVGKEGICWVLITTGMNSFRIKPRIAHYDSGAPTIFNDSFTLDRCLLGYLNSVVANEYLKVINPTINMGNTYVLSLPYIKPDESISSIVDDCISICQNDWDSFETSLDFAEHPLVRWNKRLRDTTSIAATMHNFYGELPKVKSTIELCYLLWQGECEKNFEELKEKEERINQEFIDLYGLSGEISPEVNDKNITVKRASLTRDVKSLISYLVGIAFGRYSLDNGGLIFAGENWVDSNYKTYQPDEDGIIPLYEYSDIDNGLLKMICNLIKTVFGEEEYQINIEYIAQTIGQKTSESAEEALNRYLNNTFYSDHLQTYQKRPIYWMLSSGKQGAFKCLIYLHRYNKNTLATVNTKYFLPRTAMYKAERERLETRLASGQLDAREKKNVEAELKTIEKCEEELLEYGQVLDYLANQYIELDLDDGVKENYLKFQRIPLEVNGARVKKDLLVPFGLEKDKK